MTNHKHQKALERHKQKQKEIRVHRNSYRVRHPDTAIAHPKPLSEEETLAQNKPVSEPVEKEKEEKDEQPDTET